MNIKLAAIITCTTLALTQSCSTLKDAAVGALGGGSGGISASAG